MRSIVIWELLAKRRTHGAKPVYIIKKTQKDTLTQNGYKLHKYFAFIERTYKWFPTNNIHYLWFNDEHMH